VSTRTPSDTRPGLLLSGRQSSDGSGKNGQVPWRQLGTDIVPDELEQPEYIPEPELQE